MDSRKLRWIAVAMFLLHLEALAHPTGNMVVVGENVFWSYTAPIDNSSHYGCIMVWSNDHAPKVLLQSAFPSTDYILYAKEDQLYAIERRHDDLRNDSRLLKVGLDGAVVVLWPWFQDNHRMGEGGFYINDQEHVVFARYPNVYVKEKGKVPYKKLEFHEPINRIRQVENQQLLVLTVNDCYLTTASGRVLKRWRKLIKKLDKPAFLGRNTIFDVDYFRGELLLAYWGNRTFDLINSKGERKTVQSCPIGDLPHWVAFHNGAAMLFASKLVLEAEELPLPRLWRYDSAITDIWVINE